MRDAEDRASHRSQKTRHIRVPKGTSAYQVSLRATVTWYCVHCFMVCNSDTLLDAVMSA